MGAIFLLGLLVYYNIRFRQSKTEEAVLAKLLCKFYIFLGCSATLITFANITHTVHSSNYFSTLYLLICIIVTIDGFINFSIKNLRDVIIQRQGNNIIEIFLIVSQIFAILFFCHLSN